MRCNCESSYCMHTKLDRTCLNPADGHIVMDYVGAICNTCAIAITKNGGAQYLHLRKETHAYSGRDR